MTRKALVFVPGLNCTAHLFEAAIAALRADYDIFVADHGQDDTMEAMAQRLLNGAPERFGLIGLSMGGYVAFETLRLAPQRVERLALLDTSARPDDAEAKEKRNRLIELAQSGRFADVHPFLWQRLVAREHIIDRDLERTVRDMMSQTGPEAFVRQQKAIMSRRDSRPLLGTVKVPTLVLVGEDDVLTPPDRAREMADAIPGAVLTVVPSCGHLSAIEQPAAVTQALVSWLAVSRLAVSRLEIDYQSL